ncbi:PAS domain S-box protein [Caenispirillum bisanense]|uniref:PAS domain S-box protein n=1 Tax=Caenispirillum bisanense TaxID=414052 RepID=UPI0031E44AC7
MYAHRLMSPFQLAVAVLGLGALYALAALAALATAGTPGQAVPMWPAAGVALGATLVYGPRLLAVPVVGQGLLAVAGAPVWLPWGLLATTAGAAAAWFVMRRLSRSAPPYFSMRLVLALLLGSLAGGVTAAGCGVGLHLLTGSLDPAAATAAAASWAVGDAVGMIATTPLVLAVADRRLRPRLRQRGPEAAALALVTVAGIGAVFGGLSPVPLDALASAWTIMPLVMWAALRFGVGGAACAGLVIGMAASALAAAGFGPMASEAAGGLVSLQVFVGMVTLTGMLLAAGDAARAAATDEVRRLSSAVEQSAASVVITDTKGRLIYVNPRFTETSGWTSGEVLGRTLEFLRTGRTSDAEYGDMWRTLAAGQVWHGEFLNRRKDGSLWWEQASIAPVRDGGGEVTHYVAVKEDITERKESERRLAVMVEELTRSNRELQHFASLAAHDLQEPLRAISGFAQLLRKRYGDRLDAEADSYIGFMVDGTEHMKAMFRDLMDYSQVDAAPARPVAVDLAELVARVREALEADIAAAGAEVILGPLPVVMGHRRQLEMVFGHLISNALKFRHPERRPRVIIGAARRGAMWEVHVLDNGIGIAPDLLKSLFVLFRRLHTREHYGGTGIGLAISRRIVERHGGRIWAESDGETGTAIRFTLPLVETARPAHHGGRESRVALEDQSV